MIGKIEGSAMEPIAKVLPNIPVLALSATIANTNELVSWLQKISPNQMIDKVICDKRFFNLQKFYYDTNKNIFTRIHPLSLIEEKYFEDKSILNKTFQPTPPDTWDLLCKLKKEFNMEKLDHNIYFNRNKRIELDQANRYFDELIKFMVDKYYSNNINKNKILNILKNYKYEYLLSEDINLVNLIYKLKNENKTPAIIFQKDITLCLKIARDFAKTIDTMETEKYPRLIQDRMKTEKKAERQEKKIESNCKKTNENKTIKQLMGKLKLKKDAYNTSTVPNDNIKETILTTPLQEPHNDFNFNNTQLFTESVVDDWSMKLKKIFPNTNGTYHYVIKLLWRGIRNLCKRITRTIFKISSIISMSKTISNSI
jgi:hypothetical protein